MRLDHCIQVGQELHWAELTVCPLSYPILYPLSLAFVLDVGPTIAYIGFTILSRPFLHRRHPTRALLCNRKRANCLYVSFRINKLVVCKESDSQRSGICRSIPLDLSHLPQYQLSSSYKAVAGLVSANELA